MTGSQSKVFRVTGIDKRNITISHLVTAVDVVRAITKAHDLDTKLIKVTKVEIAHPIHS